MADHGATERGQHLAAMLAAPPPKEASATTIDFAEHGMRGYENHFAILIENLFTEAECQALIEGAEQSTPRGWEQALVNVGNGEQKLITDMRLCDRILWDNHIIAAKILDRIIPFLPADIVTLTDKPHITGPGPMKRKEAWKISRLNERLRYLRYTKGMYFRSHIDGSYVTPDNEEITFVTVHLYLNGTEAPPADQWGAARNEDKPLLGGATQFLGPDWETSWDVNPRAGSVLIFQHRHLMHSGEEVRQGTKYTLRSDILYRKIDS